MIIVHNKDRNLSCIQQYLTFYTINNKILVNDLTVSTELVFISTLFYLMNKILCPTVFILTYLTLLKDYCA
jgi:hypothetical protein